MNKSDTRGLYNREQSPEEVKFRPEDPEKAKEWLQNRIAELENSIPGLRENILKSRKELADNREKYDKATNNDERKELSMLIDIDLIMISGLEKELEAKTNLLEKATISLKKLIENNK